MEAEQKWHRQHEKGRLSEQQVISFEKIAQILYKLEGNPGLVTHTFKNRLLGDFDPKSYKKLIDPHGLGVSKKTLAMALKKLEKLIPADINSSIVNKSLRAGDEIVELRTNITESRFLQIILGVPYDVHSSKLLRGQILQAPTHQRRLLLHWSSEIVVNAWEHQPKLAAMMTNVMFHCTCSPEDWENQQGRLKKFTSTCLRLIRTEDFEKVIVIEPLALFLDLNKHDEVHNTHLKTALATEKYRQHDIQIIQDYYGSVLSQLAAFQVHFDTRGNTLQSVSDIGRLIQLVSDYTDPDTVVSELHVQFLLADMVTLANAILRRLALTHSDMASDGKRIIQKLLRRTETGRVVASECNIYNW